MGRRRNPSIDNVLKWIKNGYGQGTGVDYKPFFNVRDVPSHGRSSKVLGLKTNRVHHYLSDIEYYHHVLAEFESSIEDIREQYALLPWEETVEIAEQLEIVHPKYPGTKTPIVMTSDLLLTIKIDGKLHDRVWSVKRHNSLDPENPKVYRTYEKLLIEKTYWQRRGISWRLSTEKSIPLTRAINLDSLRTSMVAKELDWLQSYMNQFLSIFNCRWNQSEPLSKILKAAARELSIDFYHSVMLFGRAVWMRSLPVDLDGEFISLHHPLKRSSNIGETICSP